MANSPKIRAAGFTLIEMLAVLTILSILAAAAVPMAQMIVKHRKEEELRFDLREIRSALDDYKHASDAGRIVKKVGASGYPRKLDDLVIGVEDQSDPKKSKIHFLRRIPTDPMAAPDVSGSDSWGKRSYASQADEPQEGDDVYDIYSKSEDTGINGRPYRQW